MTIPTRRIRIRPPSSLIATVVSLLAVSATAAFSLLVVFEWRVLELPQTVAPYYFGSAFLLWALVLLLVGYWHQNARRSREELLLDELRSAYARGELTTEEFRKRREEL